MASAGEVLVSVWTWVQGLRVRTAAMGTPATTMATQRATGITAAMSVSRPAASLDELRMAREAGSSLSVLTEARSFSAKRALLKSMVATQPSEPSNVIVIGAGLSAEKARPRPDCILTS